MARDNLELNTIAARLLLDIVPGLDVAVVFQETVRFLMFPERLASQHDFCSKEDLMGQLFRWAEGSLDPMSSYATGLLAAAMESQDIAANCRELNISLFPVLLRRLQDLKEKMEQEELCRDQIGHFGDVKRENFDNSNERPKLGDVISKNAEDSSNVDCASSSVPECSTRPKRKFSDDESNRITKRIRVENTFSNSSWAELEPYVIGKHCMFPLNSVMRQRFILQYLAPTGEYQEVARFVKFNDKNFVIFSFDLLFSCYRSLWKIIKLWN